MNLAAKYGLANILRERKKRLRTQGGLRMFLFLLIPIFIANSCQAVLAQGKNKHGTPLTTDERLQIQQGVDFYNTAQDLKKQSKYAEASKLLKQALTIEERILGSGHVESLGIQVNRLSLIHI